MTKAQTIVGVLTVLLSSLYFIYGANGSQTLLDKTIEFNNNIYTECFVSGNSGNNGSSSMSISGSTDTARYRASTDCWKSQRKLTPDDLFLTIPKYLVDEGKCSISQSEDSHVGAKNGGMYATDLACNFEGQGVYAPDYLDQMIEYKIESVGYDTLLGNFVILSFPDFSSDNGSDSTLTNRWYFGHTVLDSKWKVGDVVTTGVRFARADLSGATSGWHTHIELRRMYDGVWQSVRYVTRGKERKLEEKRLGSGTGQDRRGNSAILSSATGALNTYYFTAYNLGDPSQNDGAPCIGASGKDLCKMEASGIRTMALTVDIRNKMGIKFGDKVALTGEIGCEGLYQVEDEMNLRFRKNCIVRPGTQYCIKGDIPSKKGGACSIQKL